MIYDFLKVIVQLALRVFYKEIVIHKHTEVPSSGAIIGVGNHPNTFMDPLIVATIFKQKVGFLGNASIFVHPIVNAIFRYFNVIRVYRKKDVPEGEVMDNTDAFRESYEYLSQGKTLLIFPEGNSYRELKLRKIKTGAARIALNTEKRNSYALGVKIVPFGLNYSSPGSFRSKLHVNIGKPISVASFIDEYKKDAIQGVKLLTNKIRTSLEENLITASDQEHETLFLQLKKIYQERIIGNIKEYGKFEEYRVTKELSKSIQYFKINKPEKYKVVKEKIETYMRLLKDLNLSNSNAKRFTSFGKKFALSVLGILYSVVGFPVYLFGLIQNYLPYIIPYWIAKKITYHIEYHAPIMMTIGIFLFPLYYYLSGAVFVHSIQANSYYIMAYVLLMPVTGFYCLHYVNFIKNFRAFFKFNPLFVTADYRVEKMMGLKTELTLILDELKTSYLKKE